MEKDALSFKIQNGVLLDRILSKMQQSVGTKIVYDSLKKIVENKAKKAYFIINSNSCTKFRHKKNKRGRKGVYMLHSCIIFTSVKGITAV